MLRSLCICLGIAVSIPGAVEAQTASKFVNQCKKPSTQDIAYTIEVILKELAEPDCEKARQKLAEKSDLNLMNLGLVDLSPLAEFTQIETLEISMNMVHDLSFLKGFDRLVMLSANNNNIEDLGPVAEASADLLVLNLNKNNIADVSPLSKLPNLLQLELRDNRITGINANLSSKLVNLDLSYNYLRAVDALAHLTELDRLDVSYNEIADISPIQGNTKLKYLDVRDNEIVAIDAVAGMNELHHFSGINNLIEDASALGPLPKIKAIFLAKNNIRTIPVFESEALSELSLQENSIADASNLMKMRSRQLFSLAVDKNSISVMPSGDYLASVAKIYISHNHISSLNFLSSAKGLVSLVASSNSVVDVSPLATLEELSLVYLDANRIEDISPLKDLAKVETFNMDGNPLGTNKTKNASNCPADSKSAAIANWCAAPL